MRSHARDTAADVGLTLLRVVLGVIMTVHGAMKFSNLDGWIGTVEKLGIAAAEPMAKLAATAELCGGLGLVVGLLTPIAAFGVLCSMIVAIAKVHWPHGLLASEGGYELPLLIATSCVFFLVRGAGPFSLDALLGRAWRRRHPGEHPPEIPAPLGAR